MKLISLFVFYSFIICNAYSQDLINPYIEYQGQSSPGLISGTSIYNVEEYRINSYTGEYEILLDESHPWGNQFCGNTNAPFNFNNFGLSYQIELVSFPFSAECTFPSLTKPDGGCDQPNYRILTVPDDSLIPILQNLDDRWVYPTANQNFEYTLWRITEPKKFDRPQSLNEAYSDHANANSLVTAQLLQLRRICLSPN